MRKPPGPDRGCGEPWNGCCSIGPATFKSDPGARCAVTLLTRDSGRPLAVAPCVERPSVLGRRMGYGRLLQTSLRRSRDSFRFL